MDDSYRWSGAEVAAALQCNVATGLTEQQVRLAAARFGRNELPPEPRVPFWRLVLKQFDDLLVKILVVAALVDLAIAFASGESGAAAFVEPAVIFAILAANAVVGVVTETNAESAIAALKAYEADVAHCVREGRVSVVSAADLVPGDVVEVSVGGKVPADLRVLEIYTSTLRLDQSILTGESGSVEKVAHAIPTPAGLVYQDKVNMLFSGTVVTAGRAKCIVVGTGARTAIGQINNSLAEDGSEMTPLKAKLDEFGAFLSKVIAAICVAVWVVNVPHFGDAMHGSWLQGAIYYFKIAVALAVAAIPEGLPAVVTTCLALGTRKMARRNAIVRTLPSVETLGCTSVICTDKTGTLTTNMMTCVKVAVPHAGGMHEFDVEGSSFAPEGRIIDTATGAPLPNPSDDSRLVHCALCSALCNDSTLTFQADTSTYSRVGEGTEVALRVLAEKVGLPGYAAMPQALALLQAQAKAAFCSDTWREAYPRLATLEFDSTRKMMSVLCRHDGGAFVFSKGAPETLLPKCVYAIDERGEASLEMTPARAEGILAAVRRWSERAALRCLLLAYKAAAPGQTTLLPADESKLVLVGALGLQDPPRPEALDSVQTCTAAGIRVIMITGDNNATAEAVARQVGILSRDVALGVADDSSPARAYCSRAPAERPDGDFTSLTATEFDALPPEAQADAARALRVFSRVEPRHKRQLVQLLQSQCEVVAMTGDGVNDAPALRSANIGVAMGSGTAVAKYAADMVLADDNFATIVTAVEEGRSIFANTKQFIRYMVSSNIGEVVAIFAAALLGLPATLTPVQLLWVNLVTDGLPATALSFNKPDRDLMKAAPRQLSDGIVDRWLFFRYTVIGLYVGVVTVAGFAWWYLAFEGGPRISWLQLVQSQKCVEREHGYSCDIFRDARPSTVSMSVLVVVEMFNALNALSENSSLLAHPPSRNPWLLAAIAISMVLHLLILYVPPLSALFAVRALSWAEWRAVLWLSAPVVAVDEVLKAVTRRLDGRHSFRAHAHRAFAKYMPLGKPDSSSKDSDV